tara:strand:- start:777 stop:7271 length:6495 start_codon:yes stop_codon:yes gene_type:complete
MGIIKKYGTLHKLKKKQPFLLDRNPASDYFNITEFPETMGGGKNGFLIEGSPLLKSSTKLKIDIVDVNGDAVYFEPATSNGKTFYDGTSAVVSVWVYDDTPIGIGEITIMGELTEYIDERGIRRPIPDKWVDTYNVKWTRRFKINPTLPNKEKVRFFKKPKVTINEIVKQVYVKEIPSITQTGSVDGFAGAPEEGQDLSTWTAGTFYKIKLDTDNPSQPGFTQSMDENIISIPSLGYNPTIKEVVTPTDLLVDIPYADKGLVSNFQDAPYSVTFEATEDQVLGETSLTGSFADIKITDLKTFTGDVARVKIFRKSRNELGDFQFVQETKLESAELLRNVTNTSDTIIEFGNLNSFNVANFFVSHSSDIQLNNDKLINSMFLETDGLIHTSESIDFVSGSEYTLSYKVRKNGFSETDKLYFSISGSSTSQSIDIVSASDASEFGSNGYNQSKTITKNFVSTVSGSANLNIQADNPTANEFHIANLSLKSAEQTSFSPDEFNTIIDIPRKGVAEQFDFKFEFYDINNNFIPITVTGTKNFTGGNTSEISKLTKFLNFESNKTAFRFTTGSFGSPENQSLGFKTQFNLLTGSVTYLSSAFDTEGNYIVPSAYTQSGAHTYPGALTNTSLNGATLTIASFSGSRHNEQYGSGGGESTIVVGSITYTASMEGGQQEEFETIYRFEDGDSAAAIIATSNQSNFVYRASTLNPDPTSQTILINVARKNLGGPNTAIEINSASIDPTIVSTQPPLTEVSDSNGIKSLSIGVNQFPFETGSVTYSFTSSDDFNIEYADSVTISPVKVFGGVSVTLTNENASFEATPVGTVAATAFAGSSGSIQLKVGNEDITFDDDNDGSTANNTFSLIGVTGSGCTPNVANPPINEYGITAMSADSASLELQIRYKDGSGTTTDFSKTVSYTKTKQATPNIEVAATPSSQTIAADSKGSGSSSPDSIEVSAFEGGVDRFVSLGTPTFSNGLSGTTGGLASKVITFTSNASSMSADTGRIEIPINFQDADGVTGQKSVTCSVTRVKSAPPVIVVNASPGAQTIEATSFGTGSEIPDPITITAFEGTTNAFTSMTASGSNGMTGSISSNVFTYTTSATNMGVGPDNANITFTITHTDSEGTVGTSNVISSVSRVRKGKSAFQIILDPQVQTVVSSSSIASPSAFTIALQEGGNTYTYRHSSSPGSPYQFSVNGLTNATNVSSADGTSVSILPSTPTNNSGINTAVLLNVMDGEGQTFINQKVSHNVNVTGVGPAGAQGPQGPAGSSGTTAAGIVFTGQYNSGTTYVSSSARIDVCEFTDAGPDPDINFWKAISSGSLGQPSPSSSDWEAFGEEFDSVATDILFAQDAYANRTLNVGTSGSTKPVIALNSDFANDGANPFIGVNVSTYAASEGMYMGYDGGTPKLSLKGGVSDGFLTWDGSNLNIQGSINITGGATADSIEQLNTATGSISQLNTATGSLASDITTAAGNAATSASNAQSNAQSFATTAAGNAATSASNALARADTADAAAGNAQNAANSVGALVPNSSTGLISMSASPSGTGLFLGSKELGYYSGSAYQTYMSSSGDFYLRGDGGSLTWNSKSSSLLIQGRISGSSIQGGAIGGASIVGGTMDVPVAGTGSLFSVDAGGNMSCQDASISGSINVDSGKIGGWVVETSDEGGAFRDSNTRMKFDPALPELTFFDTSANRKVGINPNESLSTPGSSDIYITNIGTSVNATAMSITSTNSYTTTTSNYGQGTASSNFTITTAGSWEVTGLSNAGNLSGFAASTSGLPSVSATTTAPAYNYYPSNIMGYHQSYSNGATCYVYLYLSLYDTSDANQHREQLGYSYARGQYAYGNLYTPVVDGTGFSPTGYVWENQGGSYTISAATYTYTSSMDDDFLITTDANSSVRYLLYEQNITARSAYQSLVDSYGNTTVTFTTFSKSGVNITGLDASVTLRAPSNFIEVNAGGFQAVSDSTQYVRALRVAQGSSNPILFQVVGGRTILGDYSGDASETKLTVYGKAVLTNADVGSGWNDVSNAGDTFKGLEAHSFLISTVTYASAGTSASPNDLKYELSANGGALYFDPSSTQKYIELPYRKSGVNYHDADKFPNGMIVTIQNVDDGNTLYVKGLYTAGNGLADNYSLVGGAGMIVQYNKSRSVSGFHSGDEDGWFIIGHFDNTT